MLKGYMDDSGSDPNSPTFVLAGYVLPAVRWAEFSNDWAQELARDPSIDYLHMKETGRDVKTGQFQGWSLDEIEAKLLSLAAVIQAYNPLALAAHAQWSEYEKFKRQSHRAANISSPYKALLNEVVRIMYATGKKWNNPNSVDFIFDEQGQIGYEATSWYAEMKAAFPPDARSLFGSTPIFQDDKLVLPLQAADMFAWFQRRRICKPVTRMGFLKIESMITEGFTVGSELDSDSFEKAASMFENLAQRRFSI